MKRVPQSLHDLWKNGLINGLFKDGNHSQTGGDEAGCGLLHEILLPLLPTVCLMLGLVLTEPAHSPDNTDPKQTITARHAETLRPNLSMPDAIKAFGRPDACATFMDNNEKYEAWRYDDYAISSLYLIFKDGKLAYYFRK